jgi:hypothetical protein
MPKYRQLHCKIIDSFDFNEMPDDFCRVTWVLLPVILDREGRGIDSPTWIKSKMYPLRQDVTIEQIKYAMDWFASKGMIIRYLAAGRSYFYLPTWKKYQSGTEREAISILPAPPTITEPTPDPLPTGSGANVLDIVLDIEHEHAIDIELKETPESKFLAQLDSLVGCPVGGHSDVETAEIMLEEFGIERMRRAGSWIRDKGAKSMQAALRSMNTALKNGNFHDAKPVAPASQTTDFAALADEMRM